MQPAQLKLFLEKFAVGKTTEAEHQQFMDWLKNAPVPDVEFIMEEYHRMTIDKTHFSDINVDLNLVSNVETALDQYELGNKAYYSTGKIISLPFIFRVVAASVIILIAAAVVYFTLGTTEREAVTKTNAPSQHLTNEVLPGGNKALLTLSDGTTISLDDVQSGQLAKQGGAQIAKLANGQVVYKTIDSKPVEVVYNTLTTPRGGQFRLTLPDGSEVWLNSASSVKYPTAFIGNERKIEISGEAYFEIAHNPAKPFLVSVNGMTVKVLGTHFNINSYSDEASVKTTLLEGSVNLSKAEAVATLIPGQQAQLGNSGKIKVLDNVDIDQVVAWKNGYFSFNRADLQTVMRQIARWYDVDISYEGKIPERLFGGKIDRNSNATEVLKILQETKVHFRIEGNKIIVTP